MGLVMRQLLSLLTWRAAINSPKWASCDKLPEMIEMTRLRRIVRAALPADVRRAGRASVGIFLSVFQTTMAAFAALCASLASSCLFRYLCDASLGKQ